MQGYDNMDELKLVVASNLIKLRQKAGKTQVEIGQYLNYSDKTVSKWERGESLPDAYVLSRLAKLYGVTVDQLLHEENVWKDFEENGGTPPRAEQGRMFSSRIVTAVAVMGLWTMAVLMFVIFWLVMDLFLWQVFVCAAATSVLVVLVLNSVWNRGRHNMFIVMILIVGIMAVAIVFLPTRPWQLLLVLVPAEALVVLCFHITGGRWERLREKFSKKSEKP